MGHPGGQGTRTDATYAPLHVGPHCAGVYHYLTALMEGPDVHPEDARPLTNIVAGGLSGWVFMAWVRMVWVRLAWVCRVWLGAEGAGLLLLASRFLR